MSPLRLRALAVPPGVAPPPLPSVTMAATIGRSEGNTLVLPDSTGLMSRQHCRLEPSGQGWQVVDLSSNGTFVNDVLVGRGQVRPLGPGDRLKLGDWVFSVEGEGLAGPAPLGHGDAADPLDPFGVAPFARAQAAPPIQAAPLPPRHDMFGADPFQAPGSPSAGPIGGPDPFAALPDPFAGPDPFAAAPPPRAPAMPEVPPVLAGSLNSMSVPMPQVGPAPGAPTGGAPQSGGLPDDWLDEALSGLAPKTAPTPMAPPPASPPPAPMAAPPPPAAPFAAPQAAHPAPPPAPAAAPAMGGGDGMAAFLAGAAMPAPAGVAPDAAMTELGRSNRVLAGSLMRLLAARRAVKNEFRISQTMVAARENNPLKFSADEAEVLAALMGAARPGFQAGAPAVTDACRDLEAHQVALLAAFRAVLTQVFARLDPKTLAGSEDDSGLLGRLTGGAKNAAWDRYAQAYADLRQDFSEGLKGRLAQTFADAYDEESRRRGGS